MDAAQRLKIAREALAAWEQEKQARGLHLRAAPTLEWTRAWLDARNNVVELRWMVERLEAGEGE